MRRLVDRYIRALDDADVDGVVALLAEDATWSMPPAPTWYRGHRAIADFLTTHPFQVRWRHRATVANGQPAVACYAWDPPTQTYRASVLDVLTLDAHAHVTAVTAFVGSGFVTNIGLPERIGTDGRSLR